MIRSALAALLLATTAPLSAQTVAIVGGTVALGDGSAPMERANVVIRNGKVVGAGINFPVPADAEIVNASGKWVTPGIVAGFSRLGLAEVDLSMHEEEGAGGSGDTAGSADDSTANGPFSAAIDVVPAINPLNSTIAVNRADGVTRAIVAPSAGRSIFAGQGAVIDLGADMVARC